MDVKLVEKSEIKDALFIDIDSKNDYNDIMNHFVNSTHKHGMILCRKSIQINHFHFIVSNPCIHCDEFGDQKFSRTQFFNNKGNEWVQDNNWFNPFDLMEEFTFRYENLIHILMKKQKNSFFHYYIDIHHLTDDVFVNILTNNHDADKKIINNKIFYYTFHSSLSRDGGDQLLIVESDSNSDEELSSDQFDNYLESYNFTKFQIKDKDDVDERESILIETKLKFTSFRKSVEYQKFINNE